MPTRARHLLPMFSECQMMIRIIRVKQTTTWNEPSITTPYESWSLKSSSFRSL